MELNQNTLRLGCIFGTIVGASLSAVWPSSNAIIIILLCGAAGLVSGVVIELTR